jgi:hypothetical protein
MNTQPFKRSAAIAVVALLVLGALGYAARGDEGIANDSVAIGDEAAVQSPDNDVMSAIDRALGREPAVAESQALKDLVVPAAGVPSTAPRSAANDAAGGAVAPSQPAPGADPLSTANDRKIVQTASIRLQVKEVGGGFEEVGRIATGAGGFVASSNFAFVGEQQVASLTIRVPADSYQSVLSEVRRLGAKVDGETSNASDITEEYSDLTARLRNLEATETQYLQLLGQARNINEVLQVQDRLNSVRSEIERVKGRMALLDRLGELATITVHLRPVVGVSSSSAGPNNLGVAIEDAWEDSIEFLGSIAAGALTVVVFAWWLPIVAVPAWVAIQRLQRRPRPIEAVD